MKIKMYPLLRGFRLKRDGYAAAWHNPILPTQEECSAMIRPTRTTTGAMLLLTALPLTGTTAHAQHSIGSAAQINPQNASVEPLAAWQGEGNALDLFGGVPGRLQGGVTFGAGVLGSGFLFNGTDGVVRLPDSDLLKLTKSFTLSAWVYVDKLPDNPTGYGQIIFRGDSRGGYDPFFLAVHSSQNLVFHVGNADNRYVEIAAPIPLHQFVFVTASLDDITGIMRLSINNRLVAQAQTDVRPQRDLLPDWTPGLGIGNTQDAAINEPFSGTIDEVRIYDTVVGPVPPVSQAISASAVTHTTAVLNGRPSGGEFQGGSATKRSSVHTLELSIKAYIDGYSELNLQGNTLQWHHVAHAAPGRWGHNKYPTVLFRKTRRCGDPARNPLDSAVAQSAGRGRDERDRFRTDDAAPARDVHREHAGHAEDRCRPRRHSNGRPDRLER